MAVGKLTWSLCQATAITAVGLTIRDTVNAEHQGQVNNLILASVDQMMMDTLAKEAHPEEPDFDITKATD